MDRRHFLLTSLAGVLTAPLAARAQQAGRIVRVGILAAGSINEAPNAAFFDRMRDLGYIEGRTVGSRMAPAPSEPEPWTGQDKTAVAP
jgi:putative tryptophan/tyrosine transport system substrate-binding protein